MGGEMVNNVIANGNNNFDWIDDVHDYAERHLLQIGSHELLGVGELGGQFQFSLLLSPGKSCCPSKLLFFLILALNIQSLSSPVANLTIWGNY